MTATLDQGVYEEDWVIVQRVRDGAIVEWFGIPGGSGEPVASPG